MRLRPRERRYVLLIVIALVAFRLLSRLDYALRRRHLHHTRPTRHPRMDANTRLSKIAANLLFKQGLQVCSFEVVQTLWAGYGHICRIEAVSPTACDPGSRQTSSFIVKHVEPPSMKKASDESHIRKVLSYQVEQYFYTDLAPQLPEDVAVAKLQNIDMPSADSMKMSMLMTDLRETYPTPGERRAELTQTQVHAAIDWLAGFHGFWWEDARADMIKHTAHIQPPLEHIKHGSTFLDKKGVWLNGGYTYLATRRDEYNTLQDYDESEWATILCQPTDNDPECIAEMVASFLSNSTASQPYQTLIHGDVKSENLFTTNDGKRVAFFDFQYVGRGLGVGDLAKLFTCSVPLIMLVDVRNMPAELDMQPQEESLLRQYLGQLQQRSEKSYEWNIFVKHWETALVDWLRFQASWGFWGNTEWLEARVRSITKDEDWLGWIRSTTASEAPP